MARLTGARVVVPVHHEGWSHFRQGREGAERDLARAPEEVRRRVRWLGPGVATDV